MATKHDVLNTKLEYQSRNEFTHRIPGRGFRSMLMKHGKAWRLYKAGSA